MLGAVLRKLSILLFEQQAKFLTVLFHVAEESTLFPPLVCPLLVPDRVPDRDQAKATNQRKKCTLFRHVEEVVGDTHYRLV